MGELRQIRKTLTDEIAAAAGQILRELSLQRRFVERALVALDDWDAGPDRWRADALGFDECAQDRQRKIRVTGFDRLIEPFGQFALAG
jgi:hypothetical protein